MRRICVIILLSSLMTGCVADGSKHWYDEALKDARGENQEMRGFGKRPSLDESSRSEKTE